MEKREEAIVEMKNRVKAIATANGLKNIKRTPTEQVSASGLPAVFIHEGNDEVVKISTRTWRGFPQVRKVQLIIEVWTLSDADIDVKTLYQTIRNAVFATPIDGVVLEETGAYGPINNGVPGVLGMQLMLALTYKDTGPTQ